MYAFQQYSEVNASDTRVIPAMFKSIDHTHSHCHCHHHQHHLRGLCPPMSTLSLTPAPAAAVRASGVCL